MDIIVNALIDSVYTALYFVVVGLVAIFVRYVLKIKGEWYRKILHLSFMLSILCWLYIFDYWYTAAITIAIFLIMALIGLTVLERFSFYKDLLAEREQKGEVKLSLSIAFLVMAGGICFFWGIYGPDYKYIVLASIFAWGIGDALAALVGKQKRSKIISHESNVSNKTIEGTIAMFLASTIVIFLVIFFVGKQQLFYSVIVSLIAGVVGTVVEFYSKKGLDTLTLPVSLMVILYVCQLSINYF